MKNIQKSLSLLFLSLCIVIVISSCASPEANQTGSEFMPDMYHSIAYEANYYDYYYFNTWGSETEYYKMAQPRKPVEGTIARGYAGIATAKSGEDAHSKMMSMKGSGHGIAIPMNGSVPYYYGDTDDERARATAEIINNPFPITADGIAKGKELYDTFCTVCHGKKADGNGWLYSDENPNAKYPAAPANLISEEFIAASNGRYYHAMMFGKGVMGGYADKVSYEERWQIIHYLRSLHAKAGKLVYDENVNTLNNTSTPGALMPQLASMDDDAEHASDHDENGHEAGSHDDDGHEEEGGH